MEILAHCQATEPTESSWCCVFPLRNELIKSKMADEVTWPQRLHHLRYSSTLLLAEKFLLVVFLALLFVLKLSTHAIAVYCAGALISLLLTHYNHVALMESAGMPVVRFFIRI